MKKILIVLAAALSVTSCALLGNINWDSAQLGQAAGAAMTAMSITDQQIIALCAQSIAQEDAQNRIDNGSYAQRLKRVLSGVKIQGMTLDPKVYIKNEINAFASGDGSIRVYSGLMDVMDDNELFAIIGHEIGHVVNQDTKKAMKKILSDIQDGSFAKEFLLDMSPAGKQVHFKAMRKLASEHPAEKVGEEVRKLYSWNNEEDKLINN